MQLAQPLICEARIFTSSARVGSRLELMATDMPNHFFMSSGAAAEGSSLLVMILDTSYRFQHNDECASSSVTCTLRKGIADVELHDDKCAQGHVYTALAQLR